jgi:hypothetical protein
MIMEPSIKHNTKPRKLRDEVEYHCAFALKLLGELQRDFQAMGRIEQAGEPLQKLMEIVCRRRIEHQAQTR